jgi:hypothetical protein
MANEGALWPNKGFHPPRDFDNLDTLVRDSWANETQEAIFVHYLNGGYNPNIAQNEHVIAEDLKSGYSISCDDDKPGKN